MSSCLVRLVEKGHCPLPRYQPGLIDPAIAGETEHLVGMVFPEIRMSVNFTLIPASLGSFSDSRGLVHRTGERLKVISELQT